MGNTYNYDTLILSGDEQNPCKNCPNNPQNNKFASGNCCCSLPNKFNVVY